MIFGRSWHRFLPWQLSISIFTGIWYRCWKNPAAVIWFSSCFFAEFLSGSPNFHKTSKHESVIFSPTLCKDQLARVWKRKRDFSSRSIGGPGCGYGDFMRFRDVLSLVYHVKVMKNIDDKIHVVFAQLFLSCLVGLLMLHLVFFLIGGTFGCWFLVTQYVVNEWIL